MPRRMAPTACQISTWSCAAYRTVGAIERNVFQRSPSSWLALSLVFLPMRREKSVMDRDLGSTDPSFRPKTCSMTCSTCFFGETVDFPADLLLLHDVSVCRASMFPGPDLKHHLCLEVLALVQYKARRSWCHVGIVGVEEGDAHVVEPGEPRQRWCVCHREPP